MDNITRAEEAIGLCDRLLQRQLNQIMHHEAFQRLEAAWCGLQLLVSTVSKAQRIKLRFLQINLKEWIKELNSTADFEQSILFRKIYTEELDQPGGEPFGLLIGDYYFSHRVDPHVNSQLGEQLGALQQMAKICAAALTPFVTSVDATFFGIDNFADLQSTVNFERLLTASEYYRWHKLRQDEQAHFIGLTLPRILMRKPYRVDRSSAKQRYFSETLVQHEDYCWGNACYAYASAVLRSFAETGWFMSMRDKINATDAPALLTLTRDGSKITTECLITDNQEKRLNDAGFIALCDHRLSRKTTFYSNQSVKLVNGVRKEEEQVNVKLNTLLHYVLCASRFAQYIKVIIRDKVGSFLSHEACETYLTKWLSRYCSSAEGQSLEALAKNPLTYADVTVSEKKGDPGNYYCSIIISPHSQFDEIRSQLKLVTNVKLT
ncbi:MAG: type VI secretion system contractile sheath large subunit [Gammaproteobacteria bacterium]|nr:type VI secretion system contractile sheath large subunit [Gammaproteobacteria bacterium]